MHQVLLLCELTLSACPPDGNTLLCDISTGVLCLKVSGKQFLTPSTYWNQGDRALGDMPFWINSDVRRWARSCLQCQRAKIHNHTAALSQPLMLILIGSTSTISPLRYLLTCVDCFVNFYCRLHSGNSGSCFSADMDCLFQDCYNNNH